MTATVNPVGAGSIAWAMWIKASCSNQRRGNLREELAMTEENSCWQKTCDCDDGKPVFEKHIDTTSLGYVLVAVSQVPVCSKCLKPYRFMLYFSNANDGLWA